MQSRINGKMIEIGSEYAGMSLLGFLRETLDLTGTKSGCGEGFCGSCTVLIDGKPVKACREKVVSIFDKELLTIEGLQLTNGDLHPLQQSFIDAGAIQCGYCTPGMILTAHAFLMEHPTPSRNQIRKAISANLCRCTGYQQIIDAIENAAPAYQSF